MLRAERRLTQHAIAERVGVSQATYWKWETGIEEPDNETQRKIAKVFGVKAPALLEQAS